MPLRMVSLKVLCKTAGSWCIFQDGSSNLAGNVHWGLCREPLPFPLMELAVGSLWGKILIVPTARARHPNTPQV